MRILIFATLVGIISTNDNAQVVNKEFLDGYNKFATNIFTKLKESNSGSFVLSPISVDIILSLIEYGSQGETSKQLVAGLNLPENKEKLREAVTLLTPKLNVNESYTLTSANKVYVKEGFKLLDDFKQFAVDVYNAEIDNVNFEKKESAAEIINKWVEDKTLQKIKNLVNPNDLDKDTRAILINALYFRGEWKTPFDESKTKSDVFYLDNSAKTDVTFMHTKRSFKYFENHDLDAQFVELPYVGSDVTLTIALPNKKDGLGALESKIASVLEAPAYKHETVNIKLPKFKIETEIEFKPILQSLGIIDAFEDIAKFPKITGELLKISKVVQKALIEVDEAGTTAAAATSVIVPNIRSGIVPRDPKNFIADHPFVFVLKYKSVVLFIGQYTGK